MTNIDPTVLPATSPPAAPAAPADPSAGAPVTIEALQAKLDAEIAARQGERNRYKRATQAFEGLDDESVSAISEFASLVRNRDIDKATEWMLESIPLLNDGKSAADVIAARQSAEAAAARLPAGEPAPAAPQQFTQAQLDEMVDARLTQRERNNALHAQVTAELASFGFSDPNSLAARQVIEHAKRTKATSLDASVAAFYAEAAELTAAQQARVTAAAAAAAAAAAGVPAPAPSGTAPATAPAGEMSIKDRIHLRLADNKRGIG